MKTQLIRRRLELREAIADRRCRKKTLALVPTMGALHEGHLSLVKLAQSRCDHVVATIFVNPLQFGPKEDFARYPRLLEEDAAKLEKAGVELIYAPEAKEMYPADFSTLVSVKGLGDGLEGAFRPGFFDGVATVLTKLFLQILPDAVVFGEKDYQQLLVVRQFTRDLDLSIEVIGAPTVREADGLAMSSRNRYLAPEQRKIAARLFATLTQAERHITKEKWEVSRAETWAREQLLHAGFTKVDYLEMRAAETLGPIEKIGQPARLLAAAWLGDVRLIDNIALG